MWIKEKCISVCLAFFIASIVLITGTSNAIAKEVRSKIIPQFITGIYSAETDKDFKEVKAAGIDFVLSYTFFGSKNNPRLTSIEKKIEYLDRAHAHGLKVLVPLSCYQVNKGDFKGLEEFIKRVKNHPALGMWYLYDEPKHHLKNNIKKLCEILKKETPYVPTALCMNWVKKWWTWTDIDFDIWMLDCYPVMDKPFPEARIQHVYSFIEQTMRKSPKPIIPILQIYPRSLKDSLGKAKRGRYPNKIESRFMAYSQLTLGVKGLFWYSYYWGKKFDKTYMKKIFFPLVKEIKEFEKLVGDLSKVKTLKLYNEEKDIYAGYWSSKNGKYLVIQNAWPLSRKLNAYVPVVKGKQLHPIGTTVGSVISIKKEHVRVEAGPWETFVWEVKKTN